MLVPGVATFKTFYRNDVCEFRFQVRRRWITKGTTAADPTHMVKPVVSITKTCGFCKGTRKIVPVSEGLFLGIVFIKQRKIKWESGVLQKFFNVSCLHYYTAGSSNNLD